FSSFLMVIRGLKSRAPSKIANSAIECKSSSCLRVVRQDRALARRPGVSAPRGPSPPNLVDHHVLYAQIVLFQHGDPAVGQEFGREGRARRERAEVGAIGDDDVDLRLLISGDPSLDPER